MELRFERLTGEHDVGCFDSGDLDLDDFLKTEAIVYQENHLAGVYVGVVSSTIAAYFSLSADAIRLDVDFGEAPEGCHGKVLRTYPALKLGRLAVCNRYQGRGIGSEILKICLGVAIAMRDETHVGCRFITVDAYPGTTDWYLDRGFTRNLAYRSRTRSSSLRYDILV